MLAIPGASYVVAAFQFLNSPLGRMMGIGAIVVLGWAYAEHRGAERVRAEWAAANVAAKAAVDQADADIARKADSADKKETAESEVADKANEEARNAYIAELEKRAAGVCSPLTDDDVKRLRDIR